MEYGRQVVKRSAARDTLLLIVFWAYVSIPLVWGIYSTFKKAIALFR